MVEHFKKEIIFTAKRLNHIPEPAMNTFPSFNISFMKMHTNVMITLYYMQYTFCNATLIPLIPVQKER